MKFLKRSVGLTLLAAAPVLAQNPFGFPGGGQPKRNTPAIAPAAAPRLAAAPVVETPTTYLWDSGGQMSVGRYNNWGNGVAALTRTLTYNGDDVLEMTTRNFNEGVNFDVAPAADLAAYKEEGYLRLRLRFKESAPPAGTPGAGGEGAPTFGAPSSSSSGSASFGSGGRPPGGRPVLRSAPQAAPGFGGSRPPGFGGGRPPGGGFPGSGAVPPTGAPGFGEGGEGMLAPLGPAPQETKIRRLMVTFVLEKGVASGNIDLPADLEKIKPDDDGWRLFLLPVKELHFTPGATGLAQRMIITSDKEDTFYMAQAALVVETGQMSVNIRRPSEPIGTQIAEITVKPGLVTLVADVEAGTADPLIEWNFDADKVNPDLPPPLNAAPAIGAGGEGGEGGAPPTEFAPPGGGRPGFGGGEGGGRPRFGTPGGGVFGAPAEGAAPAAGAGFFGIGNVPRIDARGLVAKFEYPNEEQDYRIEVTVTDRAGKKAPVKASLLVHVRA